MSQQGRQALIAQILDQQVETYQYEVSFERMLQVLNGDDSFSKEEALILWQSPLQRSKFLNLRREKIQEINESIKKSFTHSVDQVLAADSSTENFSIRQRDFELYFSFNSPNWEIQLYLERQLREILGSEAIVVLADDQGDIWFRQQIGKGYLLSAIWPLDLPPREAIQRTFTLSVE